MASHGKVFDLFDDRYLELQDVVGNVEPLPTLVPYEQYKQHPITYRMDTNHEIFLVLLQDFTARKAHETGKELWTWCVQWHVDETTTHQSLMSPRSPKKPRLDTAQPDHSPAQRSRRSGAPITAQPRVIDPELIHEEDMLRILVDIVQVDSAVVPNFIEFLYRWIDFYEGDGKALKAALRGEIPSLWDFEYHPLVVSEDVKKRLDEANGESEGESGNRTPEHRNAQELAQNSPTKKMRQKPDLAELERKAEESERLQYREVHFGIRPPKLNEPLPPLINIPRDVKKRAKYHAACFKSRQRAFYMLMEAGITPQQMRDYNRGQEQSVRDTPPADGRGLKNYERDAHVAQKVFLEKENQVKKQMEIAISHQLAVEAQVAERSPTPEGSSGVPLIPPTPSHSPLRGIAEQIQRKIQQQRCESEQTINIVPTPLVGKMKSRLFRGARDRQTIMEASLNGFVTPTSSHTLTKNEESDTDSAGNGDNTNDEMGMSSSSLPSLPSLPRLNLPPLPRPASPGQTLPTYAQNTGISTPQQPTSAHFGPSPSATESIGTFAPPPGSSLPAPVLYPTPSITVTPPQAPQVGSQHQSFGSFGEHDPFTTQTAALFSRPPTSLHSISGHGSQSGGLNIAGSSNRPSSNTYGHGSNQATPTQSFAHFAQQQPHGSLSSAAQQTHTTSYPVVQGLSVPNLPLSFTQRLLATQQEQSNYTIGQEQQQGPPTLLTAGLPGSTNANHHLIPNIELQNPLLLHPPSPTPLPLSRPGIQRSAPSPLPFIPPPSPFSSLAPSLLATSPFGPTPTPIPIQIYFPRIVIPANTLGPGGTKLGNFRRAETDAFLLGHTYPSSGTITLTKAIFLPVGVWHNATERVRKGKHVVLESYPAPGPTMPNQTSGGPHRAVYEKLEMAYRFMGCGSAAERERELTKRWRVSPGPMTASERGAVWEGWAVELDRGVSLERDERLGAVIHDFLVDGESAADRERERRRMEIEELLGEDDGDMDMDL